LNYSPSISSQVYMKKPGWLIVAALAVVLFAVMPLLYVVSSSGGLDSQGWLRLWQVRLPELISNTLLLAISVALLSLLLGLSTAWITARKNFFGRKTAIWLMVLPLTIPTYVLAHIYTVVMEEDGWLGQWIGGLDIYNLAGATVVLSLAGFSYIYLLGFAALTQMSRDKEEAATLLGASRLRVIFKVQIPILRPALMAGIALIVLHVLSDFGAVSMLRFQTFTLAIYNQMTGRLDTTAAAALSLILVIFSLVFLVLERFFRRKQRYYASVQAGQYVRKNASSGETIAIWLWVGAIAFASFILPVIWMLKWSGVAFTEGLLDTTFWSYAWNSGVVAFAVASVTLIIALPIALYQARQQNFLSNSLVNLSSVGFVLPGPVIALGILAFVLAQLPWIYGSLFALLFALAIRFLPLAVQSEESALQQLTPSIEQAGRLLGAGPFENLRRVILPVIRNGLAAAWVLVFIDALKELPATLILRPTGFDTLPVRIWMEASEEMLELAAPAALVLVIGTFPAIWLMMKTQRQ
jgi:iron(III) transport system permease protein